MRREPPPVKRHTRGRPSNLPLPLSKDLAFELPAAGTEGQKWKETNEQSQCMYSAFRGSLMSKQPGPHVLCSPVGDHSSCRHTPSEGGTQLMHLCCTAASWNRYGGHCIISWFFYAQNTSSAWTSSQLLYLISTELIYYESPGLHHGYNQVHVYKISYGTQRLKWNIQWIARVIQRIVLMVEEPAHWKHLFVKSCFAYFII